MTAIAAPRPGMLPLKLMLPAVRRFPCTRSGHRRGQVDFGRRRASRAARAPACLTTQTCDRGSRLPVGC